MRCRVCNRPALFRSLKKKGKRHVHGDKHHDLCQRCFRDTRNRTKVVAVKTQILPPFPPLEILLQFQREIVLRTFFAGIKLPT